MKELDHFFCAKSIAVIGASREKGKIGHTILQNLVFGGYRGEVYPVNPGATEILRKKCYPKITAIPELVDLAIIAVPVQAIFSVMKDVIKKKVRAVVVVTSGFKEVGNAADEKRLALLVKKHGIRCIGPNCLGVFDAVTHVDSLFLPTNRLVRPVAGAISFVSQSGALGSAMLDLAAASGLGFAKFVSYGNAIDVNESDLLEYLAEDAQTRVICLYVEGLVDGKRFLRTAKTAAQKKPIIAIKGGKTSQGTKAALSHTGSIAGEAGIYSGVFKQAGIIEVEGLEELFAVAHVFEKCSCKPVGKRVQIMTNGGGHGILATDAIAEHQLGFAEFSSSTKKALHKKLPRICSVANPLDLVGDATAERFIVAFDACLADSQIDALVVNLLPQTPTVDHEKLAAYLKGVQGKKPVVVVMTGGAFAISTAKKYEAAGYPVYQYPSLAVKALAAYLNYYL